MLALPVLLGTCLLLQWSPSFPLHALAHLGSLLPHDLVLWTDGSVPSPFRKGGFGVLANCSLCGNEATLSFSAGPVCSSFSAEACAILPALCWSWQSLPTSTKSAISLHFSSCLTIVLSSPLISNSVFSLLFYQATMGPRTLISTGERRGRRAALLAPSAIPCSLSPLISDWRRTVSSKFFGTQVPSVSTEELVLPPHARCVLSRLRCNGHSLISLELRILPAALVDTRPRTSLISFCTVQLRTLCTAHSLATLLSLCYLWSRP